MPAMPTFAACYCALHGIAPDRFAGHCLPRVLYAHARLARPWVAAVDPDFFEADLALLRAAGELRGPRDFAACCSEYRLQLARRSFARRRLRIRISLRRLYRLVATLTASPHSDPPERAYPPGAGQARRRRRESTFASV
jgi:hypothetical protein